MATMRRAFNVLAFINALRSYLGPDDIPGWGNATTRRRR